MSDNNGWIKVHRKIFQNPIVTKDSEYFIVWMYLLVNASHTEYPVIFNGEKITLHAGQLITGRFKIAENTGVCESKVRRIMKSFKNDQQIDQQSCTKNSLITILNWDKYQISDQQNGQRVTNNRPTTDQQLTTNKNIKNIKNKKNNGFSCTRNYDYEDLEKRLILVKTE